MKMIARSVSVILTLTIFLVSYAPGVQAQGSVLRQSGFNVLKWGAKADGSTKDTEAIQRAIDKCSASGGGTVYFPPGTYLSGSLHLKGGVALYLDHGATVKASRDENDFDPYEELGFENDADRETSYFHYALIWGEDVEHIAILGTGAIDGNREKRGGPKPIALKRCKYVTIRGVTIINAPNYAISMLGTDYVNIDGVTILKDYCDGIDPDCCHHVRISNCHIESWDDAIVPKASFSLGYRRSTENITVANCLLATSSNAFKFGTESGGDFKRIIVSNCVMFKRPEKRPPTSGIAIESVDGSNIDGVVVNNISMVEVRAPIFIRLGNRGRDMETPVPGTLKNVMISNVVATGAELPSSISGIPGHSVEGVTLENIRISLKGGGTLEQTQIQVPEKIGEYPAATMFGPLPAYGLYCRHVRGLRLSGIQLGLEAADQRHAFVGDEVSDLEIESFTAPQSPGAAAVIQLNQVQNGLIRGCRGAAGTGVFLTVRGASSDNIVLMSNDFGQVRTPYELAEEVNDQCVVRVWNRMP